VAFGRVVRRERERKGWSQADLAGAADVDQAYIGGLERGSRNPTLIRQAEIAQALGVELGKLITAAEREAGKGEPGTRPSPPRRRRGGA
jgi:transcriptional regulator with XRE-family HTH domain